MSQNNININNVCFLMSLLDLKTFSDQLCSERWKAPNPEQMHVLQQSNCSLREFVSYYYHTRRQQWLIFTAWRERRKRLRLFCWPVNVKHWPFHLTVRSFLNNSNSFHTIIFNVKTITIKCCNFTNTSVKWEVKINTSNNINHVDKLCIHVFISIDF